MRQGDGAREGLTGTDSWSVNESAVLPLRHLRTGVWELTASLAARLPIKAMDGQWDVVPILASVSGLAPNSG